MQLAGYYCRCGIINQKLLEPVVEYVQRHRQLAKARSEVVFQKGGLLLLPLHEGLHRDEQLLELIDPILQVLKTLKRTHQRVPHRIELSILKPGGLGVEAHYDMCLFHALADRLHVPLITDNQTSFYSRYFNEQVWTEYKMEKGYIYSLNNRIPHKVINRSTQYRCHLIVDYLLESDLQKYTTAQLLELQYETFNPVYNPFPRQ